jgi:hypothetical protein
MKKLLALILCVMMFVAVIPTAAFAGGGIVGPTNPVPTPPVAPATYTTWEGKMTATKAVEDLGDAIKNMYGGIAADQGVFNTVKAIDETVKSLADQMFDGVDKFSFGYVVKDATGNYVEKSKSYTTNKALTDDAKEYLREHIGNEITKYMNEHLSSFTSTKTVKVPDPTDSTKLIDKTYTVYDPVKYMNNFATAASKAMSSDKAAKNIEAIVYAAALAKTQKEAKDKMDDLYNDMQAWGDLDKLADYGWTNTVGDPSTSSWQPYVFLDADAGFYDYGYGSNVSTILSEFAE